VKLKKKVHVVNHSPAAVKETLTISVRDQINTHRSFQFFKGKYEPEMKPAIKLDKIDLVEQPFAFRKRYVKQTQLYGISLMDKIIDEANGIATPIATNRYFEKIFEDKDTIQINRTYKKKHIVFDEDEMNVMVTATN
jgi:hypothetical protein